MCAVCVAGVAVAVITVSCSAGPQTSTPPVRAPVTQPDAGATYAEKLNRDESRIDWSEPVHLIERKIRALNPWPGVWFEIDGTRIKLLAGDVVPGRGAPGLVLDEEMTIACGDGAFRPQRLQREGRRPTNREAFLRGSPVAAGTRLT